MVYKFFNGLENPFCGSPDRGVFQDAVAEMDGSIGNLIHFIGRSGIRKDPMIILSSDNW